MITGGLCYQCSSPRPSSASLLKASPGLICSAASQAATEVVKSTSKMCLHWPGQAGLLNQSKFLC